MAMAASCYKPVYEALRAKLAAESDRRKGRSAEAWILAERECVLREVNRQRSLLDLDPVSITDVERAERVAVERTMQRIDVPSVNRSSKRSQLASAQPQAPSHDVSFSTLRAVAARASTTRASTLTFRDVLAFET